MTALTSRGYVYQVAGDPADAPAATQALAAAVDADISACVPDLGVTSFGDYQAMMLGEYAVGLNSSNDVIGCAIRPRATVTPTKFVWWCTVQSGNYDVAIINLATGVRLWSSGSLACPAPGEVVVPIVAGPTLAAGTRYRLCIAADNTTLRMWGNDGTAPAGLSTMYDGTVGVGRVAASFPIPATVGALTAVSKIPALALRA